MTKSADAHSPSAVSQILHRFDGVPVLLEDTLGEGSSGWHDAPTQRTDATNCLNWLFAVVAATYEVRKGIDHEITMNALRYYESGYHFGLRKHFAEQWLDICPGPFVRIPLPGEKAQVRDVHLEPRKLAQRRGYDGTLYAEKFHDIQFPYYSRESLWRACRRSGPGVLVAFGVASRECVERNCDAAGPLGLMHCLFLEKAWDGTLIAHHASTSSGAIEHESMLHFLSRTGRTYAGFCVFRLNGSWRPQCSIQSTLAREIVAREKHFPRGEAQS